MGLSWHVTGEDARGRSWAAEYDAYETPVGPARAVARTWPHERFHRHETDYGTWLHDPYLALLGCRCDVLAQHGRKIGGDHEEKAKAACEEHRGQLAGRVLDNLEVREMYAAAFPALATRHLEGRGLSVTRFERAGGLRAIVGVASEEGEATVEVWLSDDMRIETEARRA